MSKLWCDKITGSDCIDWLRFICGKWEFLTGEPVTGEMRAYRDARIAEIEASAAACNRLPMQRGNYGFAIFGNEPDGSPCRGDPYGETKWARRC